MKTGGRKVERKLPLMARSHGHLNIHTIPTTICKCVHLCVAIYMCMYLCTYVHILHVRVLNSPCYSYMCVLCNITKPLLPILMVAGETTPTCAPQT